jgi:small subunit ribosomal protein S3
MGQKVHPKIFRIGTTQTWKSKWFSKKNFSQYLEQDVTIRRYLLKKLATAGVADISIERSGATLQITIHTSKPGVVIGRGGAGAEELRKEIAKKFLSKKQVFKLNIEEISQPSLNAQIVCQNMIEQIEKRLPFRRVLKQAVDQVQKAGAKESR